MVNRNHLVGTEVYARRASEGVAEYLDVLYLHPEHLLSPQEMQKVLEIEKSFVFGGYEVDSNASNGEWYKPISEPIDFVLEYFTTEEGYQDICDLISSCGVPINEPDRTEIGVSRTLSVMATNLVDRKDFVMALKRLSIRSHAYVASCIQKDLLSGAVERFEPNHFTIHTNPEGILASIKDINSVRNNLRGAFVDIGKREDLTEKAKEALGIILRVYIQKTAQRLGQLYPDFIDLYSIAMLLPDSSEKTRMLTELQHTQQSMFTFAVKIEDEENDISRRFAWTMDRWRNGTVFNDIDSAVNSELREFISIVESPVLESSAELAQPILTAEESEKLKNVIFDAQSIAAMARLVLSKNGILSTDDDLVLGKWPKDSSKDHPRVGISIGPYRNLAYSKGWIKIPEDFRRKAFQQSPSGALQVLAHEIEHVLDGITAYKSDGLKLKEVNTRGSITLWEGIGKAAEQDITRRLIGQSIKPSLTYHRALQVWIETHSEIKAIEAFARQAASESGSDEPTAEQYTHAENRVQRLIGKRGLNSQALAYIEQALVAHHLDKYEPDFRDYISANSSLDLQTQALLHGYGLLERDRYRLEFTTVECVEEYIKERYLQK